MTELSASEVVLLLNCAI